LSATIGSGLIVSPNRATATGSVADADEVLISDASDSYATKKATMTTIASYMQEELTFTAAGGSNTQVQYNNSNAFAGSSAFTFNSATNTLAVTEISSSGNISGSKFYGDGTNITGLPSAAISSYTNSGDNRIITSVNSSTVNAEASLTFDGSKLAVVGAISGSGLLESVGGAVLGGALLVTGSIAGGASISGSGVISGKDLVIDDGRRIGIASDTDLMVLTDSQLRIKGTLTASAPIQGRSLTVAGGEVISKNGALKNITSATVGGAISGSSTLEAVGAAVLGNTLSVTGSITSATSLGTATTIINATHVSSSLNISGAAFYGDGSNLSGISTGTSTAYNSYTLNFTVSDSHDILGIVTTGSAITASLPTAATFDAGQKIIFKDVSGSCSGSNHIVISASQNHAGEQIDGQGVIKIETGYGALTLASDGVKSYYIVSTS
jgi:hypothetical protein